MVAHSRTGPGSKGDVSDLEVTGFDTRVALEEATQQEAARSEQAAALGSLPGVAEVLRSLGGPRVPRGRGRGRAHDHCHQLQTAACTPVRSAVLPFLFNSR